MLFSSVFPRTRPHSPPRAQTLRRERSESRSGATHTLPTTEIGGRELSCFRRACYDCSSYSSKAERFARLIGNDGTDMIEFQGVTKRFPDGTYAVKDFSLVLPSHKVTVFVGSSGAGKTTLLRMINRMVDPTSGTVLIDGEDVADLDPVSLRRKIGYVLQASGLLPHRRIADNISSVPRLNGVPKKKALADALTLLDTVGLDRSLANRYPDQLSGGQQQRVGVARALASDPNILLMDEPFGAVDPIVRLELQEEVERLQRELRKTMVFVTHNIDEAFAIADQVVILRAGGVVAQVGTPEEILSNPADDFVSTFIGADKGKRTLHLKRREDGVTLVVDAEGRPAGILEADK